jgi:hypothetical protein
LPLLASLALIAFGVPACLTTSSAPLPESTGGPANLLPGIAPLIPTPDPGFVDNMVGLYFAEFVSNSVAHAFMEVRLGDVEGQLSFATIDGFGFTLNVSDTGRIEVVGMQGEFAGAVGEGVVVSEHSFVFTTTVVGSTVFGDNTFSVEASRLLGTDVTFPLTAEPDNAAVLLPPSVVGTITSLDPVTGLQTTIPGTVFITTSGNTAEFNIPLGGRFTAVFYLPLRAVIRVVDGATGEYATVPGSASSTNKDVLGRFDFSPTNLNGLSAYLAIQSRDPFGSQTQQIVTFTTGS